MDEAAHGLVLGGHGRALVEDRHHLELRDRELDGLAVDDRETAAAARRLAQLDGDVDDRQPRDVLRLLDDRAARGEAVERRLDLRRRADVLEEEERDRAEADALAIADRHHRAEVAVLDERAVRRAEIAKRPRVAAQLEARVAPRDRGIEDAEPFVFELATDHRAAMQPQQAAPRVDEHRGCRMLATDADLLRRDRDRRHELLETLGARDAGGLPLLAADKAAHATSFAAFERN